MMRTRRRRRRDPGRTVHVYKQTRTHAAVSRTAPSTYGRRGGSYRVEYGGEDSEEHARSEQDESSAHGGAETLPARA